MNSIHIVGLFYNRRVRQKVLLAGIVLALAFLWRVQDMRFARVWEGMGGETQNSLAGWKLKKGLTANML